MDKYIGKDSALNNIYELNGKVPIGIAIPFGLQHVLAMFVSNIMPIILVCGVAKLNGGKISGVIEAQLIQNCMFMAGIASLIQIIGINIGIGKIGSGLPIIMGISFTFLATMMSAAARDYNLAIGGVIVGGCVEGILGLTYKFWKKLISPIVSACVVCAIGLSLFSVGAKTFGGGTNVEDFGAAKYWIVGTVTLVVCIVWANIFKGPIKALSALVSLVVGYIVAILFGMVDFSKIMTHGLFAFPKPFPTGMPKFDFGIIISFIIVFIVSATETIGDSSALCESGLKRNITDEELSGSLCCDGFISTITGVFGCSPITSFSQNIGLCAMTKVVNRFAIGTGAVILVIAGFFPPLAGIFLTIPKSVLGGCTLMMFGQILISGIQMIYRAGFTERNVTIASLSLVIGGGFTTVSQIFQFAPKMIQDIFAKNIVAVVFVVAVVLDIALPKDKK